MPTQGEPVPGSIIDFNGVKQSVLTAFISRGWDLVKSEPFKEDIFVFRDPVGQIIKTWSGSRIEGRHVVYAEDALIFEKRIAYGHAMTYVYNGYTAGNTRPERLFGVIGKLVPGTTSDDNPLIVSVHAAQGFLESPQLEKLLGRIVVMGYGPRRPGVPDKDLIGSPIRGLRGISGTGPSVP